MDFGLPTNHEHPKIEMISPTELAALHHRANMPQRQLEALASGRNNGSGEEGQIAAVYDRARKMKRASSPPAGVNLSA